MEYHSKVNIRIQIDQRAIYQLTGPKGTRVLTCGLRALYAGQFFPKS